jgi:hypothetical protein
MEISLAPEIEERLARIASEEGKAANQVVVAELDRANADAPIYAPDERFFEEADEPESGLRFALRAL